MEDHQKAYMQQLKQQENIQNDLVFEVSDGSMHSKSINKQSSPNTPMIESYESPNN